MFSLTRMSTNAPQTIMHRVGRLEAKISYLVNALFSLFISLQSLGLAANARNRSKSGCAA